MFPGIGGVQMLADGGEGQHSLRVCPLDLPLSGSTWASVGARQNWAVSGGDLERGY